MNAEELVVRLAEAVSRGAEAAAVIVVAIGTVEAFVRTLFLLSPNATHGGRKAVWRRFGVWLLLALEFELAADIAGSIAAPSWQEVGQLGAIAIIRTFLNYFLEKDLDEAVASGSPEAGRE